MIVDRDPLMFVGGSVSRGACHEFKGPSMKAYTLMGMTGAFETVCLNKFLWHDACDSYSCAAGLNTLQLMTVWQCYVLFTKCSQPSTPRLTKEDVVGSQSLLCIEP